MRLLNIQKKINNNYYRYNNSYSIYKQNQFYKSVKYIEENNNKEIIQIDELKKTYF